MHNVQFRKPADAKKDGSEVMAWVKGEAAQGLSNYVPIRWMDGAWYREIDGARRPLRDKDEIFEHWIEVG